MSSVAPKLGLLHGFEERLAGRTLDLPLSAQRLVAFLALHERPLQRPHVAGCLWLESSEEHANASLRTTLGRQGYPLVEASGNKVALAPGVEVDLHEVRAQARRVLRHELSTPDDVDDLCLAGELLPDWYDDWVLIERERFRQLRLHALDALCEAPTASTSAVWRYLARLWRIAASTSIRIGANVVTNASIANCLSWESGTPSAIARPIAPVAAAANCAGVMSGVFSSGFAGATGTTHRRRELSTGARRNRLRAMKSLEHDLQPQSLTTGSLVGSAKRTYSLR